MDPCPEHYYSSPEPRECHECYPFCKNCNGPSMNDCIDCYDFHYLYDGECVNPCPYGTYKDNESKRCVECSYPCLTCTGIESHCLSC
jgi:proprotein convertase subtilisin/kexin type 5